MVAYEALQSYVPPFYEGRSLPSTGAMVRVTALPQISDNGVPLDPTSLSFVWFLNDTVLTSVSGTGKQSANIRLDFMTSRND